MNHSVAKAIAVLMVLAPVAAGISITYFHAWKTCESCIYAEANFTAPSGTYDAYLHMYNGTDHLFPLNVSGDEDYSAAGLVRFNGTGTYDAMLSVNNSTDSIETDYQKAVLSFRKRGDVEVSMNISMAPAPSNDILFHGPYHGEGSYRGDAGIYWNNTVFFMIGDGDAASEAGALSNKVTINATEFSIGLAIANWTAVHNSWQSFSMRTGRLGRYATAGRAVAGIVWWDGVSFFHCPSGQRTISIEKTPSLIISCW